MSESGSELRNNNERIVKLMALLRAQRDEMSYLIEKQQEEKNKIENEIEKLSFKLSLLTKSLNQRVQAKLNYDRTIKEIEENYLSLVQESGKLLDVLSKEVHDLEEIMDKKIGTGGNISPQEKDKKAEITEEASSVPSTPPSERKNEAPDEGAAKAAKPSLPESQRSPIAPKLEEQKSQTSATTSQNEEERKSQTSRPSESSRLSEERRKSASLESDRRSSIQSGQRKSVDTQGSNRTGRSSQDPFEQNVNNNKKPMNVPPPIKRGDSSDAELQSYREAYERQHMAPSPPRSMDGVPIYEKTRRGSKNSKRSYN